MRRHEAQAKAKQGYYRKYRRAYHFPHFASGRSSLLRIITEYSVLVPAIFEATYLTESSRQCRSIPQDNTFVTTYDRVVNMTSHFPSIQSFYSREVPSDGGARNSSTPTKAGDGFTPSEVDAVVKPLSRSFEPSRHYDVCPIAELQTGPHNYKITGRLVNFSSTGGPHRTSTNAGGYHFLVICDGTAAIAVSSIQPRYSNHHSRQSNILIIDAISIVAIDQAILQPIRVPTAPRPANHGLGDCHIGW